MAEASQYLDFEKPVIDVEEELTRVKGLVEAGDLSKVGDVEKLRRKLDKLRKDVFGNLSAYQRVRLSRHFERPLTSDYINYLITDFIELHGDRCFGDDPAIIGGIGQFQGKPVMVVGHQRGRGTNDRIHRNFGMSQPEGNRKAQRLFLLAEKFNLPLLLFIDTQGAYPGLEAEARGQAESIAKCLFILGKLKTPIVATVIGEGGSGGALALGVCDRLLMLENSIYSVISPEGCASILWGKSEGAKIAERAKEAAESLKVTAQALFEAKIVDEVIREPIGGAHRNLKQSAEFCGQAIAKHLSELENKDTNVLLDQRYEKLRKIGAV